MQLSKIFKGLVIALPVMTLVACGSSQQANEQMAETNQTASTAQTETVQGGDAVQPLSFEEQQAQKKAELSRENTIRFDFDKAGIKAEWVDLLNKHAEYLVANPSANVTIEGHCDERGTPEYNIALGERRANAVSQFLTNYGVSSSQISSVSYGEEKPVDTSRTEYGMSQNRRAVLVYSY
jgi:peptidoglycan-associated lipoprotein